MDCNLIWEYLEDNNYFTNEELGLVTCLNGYTERTFNDMIYARYGYHDIFQLLDSTESEGDYLNIELYEEWNKRR